MMPVFLVSSIWVRRVVLIAVFTSLYSVFRYFPTFPMYGIPGSQFRASDFLAPFFGVLLGPWLSVPCIIIGTVINYGFFPPIFFGFDFLPAVVAAVSAGFLSRGKTWVSIVIYSALLALFVSFPLSTDFISIPGGNAVPYTWLHILGLLALVSPLGFRAARWIAEKNGNKFVAAVVATTLSATLAQHLMGGILTILVRFPIIGIATPGAASAYWTFIFGLYPIERSIITLVASAFGASAISALRASGYLNTLASVTGIRLSSQRQN